MINDVDVVAVHRNFGVPGEGMKAVLLDEISGKNKPVAILAPAHHMFNKLKAWKWLEFLTGKTK